MRLVRLWKPAAQLQPQAILYVGNLKILLLSVWFMLLDALPVAVTSVAIAHAARTGRRWWLAGLIVLVVLGVLAANLFGLVSTVLPAVARATTVGQPLPFSQVMQDVGVAAPVVVMLVALLYALTIRPQRRAAALAGT